MKRKRHTQEQIIRKRREADAELSAGKGIGEILQTGIAQGDVTRAQTGCTNRVDWSCVSGCP